MNGGTLKESATDPTLRNFAALRFGVNSRPEPRQIAKTLRKTAERARFDRVLP